MILLHTNFKNIKREREREREIVIFEFIFFISWNFFEIYQFCVLGIYLLGSFVFFS